MKGYKSAHGLWTVKISYFVTLPRFLRSHPRSRLFLHTPLIVLENSESTDFKVIAYNPGSILFCFLNEDYLHWAMLSCKQNKPKKKRNFLHSVK